MSMGWSYSVLTSYLKHKEDRPVDIPYHDTTCAFLNFYYQQLGMSNMGNKMAFLLYEFWDEALTCNFLYNDRSSGDRSRASPQYVSAYVLTSCNHGSWWRNSEHTVSIFCWQSSWLQRLFPGQSSPAPPVGDAQLICSYSTFVVYLYIKYNELLN